VANSRGNQPPSQASASRCAEPAAGKQLFFSRANKPSGGGSEPPTRRAVGCSQIPACNSPSGPERSQCLCTRFSHEPTRPVAVNCGSSPTPYPYNVLHAARRWFPNGIPIILVQNLGPAVRTEHTKRLRALARYASRDNVAGLSSTPASTTQLVLSERRGTLDHAGYILSP